MARKIVGWDGKLVNSVGEISPKLYFRSDLDIYERGLKLAKNCFISTEGSIFNAPVLKETKKIYLDDINLPPSIFGKAFKTFKYSMQKDIAGKKSLIFVFTPLKLFIVSLSTGVVEKQFDTTYIQQEIQDLSITQLDNTVLICSKGHKPSMIKVEEEFLPNTAEVDFWGNMITRPVKPIDTEFTNTIWNYENAIEWRESENSSNVVFQTVTANLFEPTFVDKLIKGVIRIYGGIYRIDKITVNGTQYIFNTTRISNPEFEPPIEPEAFEKINALDLKFSVDMFGVDNYPSMCTLFQSRLVFSGIPGNRNAIAFSRINQFLDFQTGLNDDDGVTIFIPSSEVEEVIQIISYNSFMIFTKSNIWSTGINSIFKPTASQLFQQIGVTPSNGKFALQEGFLYYLGEFGERVYRLHYNGDVENYVSSEITVYSRHLFERGVKEINSVRYAGNNYLVANTFGTMNFCLLDYRQKVMAWTRYTSSLDYDIIVSGNMTYFLYVYDDNLIVMNFSSIEFRDDMEVQLLPPKVTNSLPSDLPFIYKHFYIKELYTGFIGRDYDFSINDVDFKKAFGETYDGYPVVKKALTINADADKPITIKNHSNKKLEILSIAYRVESETED